MIPAPVTTHIMAFTDHGPRIPSLRYVVSQNPARDLHWETGESWGAAVEGRLFNLLNLSVEYFDKRNKDLIFSVYAPSSAGGTSTGSSTSTTDRNIGTISNRGWEISADFDIVKSKDWTVSVSANLTTTKNKIVKLPEQNKRKPYIPLIHQESLDKGRTCLSA